MQSAAKTREQVQEERQQKTQQNRGPEREIHGNIFASPCKISGQVPERNPQASKQINEAAGEKKQQAKFEKQSRESGHLPQITPRGE